MIHITVVDEERTISFPVEDETLDRVVAACCSGPAKFEDLLLAAEAFEPGITRRVIDALLDFDRAVARWGVDAMSRQLTEIDAEQRQDATFEALDSKLIRLATDNTSGVPLVIIGLETKSMKASAGIQLRRAGEVRIDGRKRSSVTYDLPSEWTLEFSG